MIPSVFSLLVLPLLPLAHAQCTRASLLSATSRYLASQSMGDVRWLSTVLSPTATYSENLVDMSFTNASALLARPLRIDYHRTTTDETGCATYTELLGGVGSPEPWQVATQLRFDGGSGQVLAVDSIATTTGDLLFNASHALHYYLLEETLWRAPVEPGRRDSRKTLQAAADAYYDVFYDKTVSVPWGEPCTRVEGGYLDANGSCAADVPDIDVRTTGRRYVIDDEVGSVNVIARFGILGPDSHEFRIVDGKIRGIHSMTLCRPVDGCGLAPPPALSGDVGF